MRTRAARILLSTVISVAMILSSGAMIFAEGSNDTNLVSTTSATQVEVGDTFEVTVALKDDIEMATFSGGISFDKNVVDCVGFKGNVKWHNSDIRLNYVTAVSGETYVDMDEYGIGIDEEENSFGMYHKGVYNHEYKAGNLVTITFEAKALGNANITLYESTDHLVGTGSTAKAETIYDCEDVNPGYTVTVVDECSHNITEVIGKDYYHCSLCDKYFSDQEGTNEIQIKGVEANLERLFKDVAAKTGIRLADSNRIKTSLTTANKLKEILDVDRFDTAIITNAWNYPDALAGGYLSSVRNNAPILLTDDSNNATIVQYVADNVVEGSEVYILGDGNSVSTSIETMLSNEGYTPVRLAGSNRINTSVKILEEAGVEEADSLIVCNAYNYADSLPASALGMPILLVDGTELRATVAEFLEGKTFEHIYILGGTGAVDGAYDSLMRKYLSSEAKAAGNGVQRLAGGNRIETSTMIAETLVPDATAVVLVYGWNFPDGLSAGPLANASGTPIILATSESNRIELVKGYINNHPTITNVCVLGGDSADRITTAAYKQIMGW